MKDNFLSGSFSSQTEEEIKRHISYSELILWNTCPYKHKLVYIDKIPREGSVYMSFGSAIHLNCEKQLLNKFHDKKILCNNFEDEFVLDFVEQLKVNLNKEFIINNKQTIRLLKEQGIKLIEHILPSLDSYFLNKYELIKVEEMLMEDCNFDNSDQLKDFKFKGYIDLVIKSQIDNKYHIIDWKTCNKGWDPKKKNDKYTNYQLALYKYYYSKKYNIDLNDIETHFFLLKRGCKIKMVEPFKITSGIKKIDNAKELVKKALINISKGNIIKNRLSCIKPFRCEFYKTEYCK